MNHHQILNLLAGRGNEVHGIHLGLHRIATLMQALGNPHQRYSILHIAGTNGKGSVAAMSESILRSAGWKTGLYTSPHLERLEERIRVAGRDVSARRFDAAATQIYEIEEELCARAELDIRLTYFEFLTACALLIFAEEKLDVAVIEVGLGGRLDATNIVSPKACIITGIALDHQDLLGSTLAEIASEKAGIIKPGVPVLSGCRAPEARRVIEDCALREAAPLTEIDRDCRLRVVGEWGAYLTINLKTPKHDYRQIPLSLAGAHQARNAALAIAGVELLEGFPVSAGAVRRGIAHTRWPGRLDQYEARRRTLLDGAHNEEGARALRNHLLRCEDAEIHLVFGALRDKDIRSMGKLLFSLARTVHLAPIPNSRTADPEEIAASHPRFRSRIRIHNDARKALRAAWNACPDNGLVVVTGSLYLVGQLLPLVRPKT